MQSQWIFDRSKRTRLWISGKDRAKFLHNLCTQDINGMSAGQGREAFITSHQGRTLAYITAHAERERLLIRADAGCLAAVMPHLRKYGIFDDVEFDDVTETTAEWHLAGPDSEAILQSLGIEPGQAGNLGILSNPDSLEAPILIREAPYGVEGWTLIGPSGESTPWLASLRAKQASMAGALPTEAELEGLRILAGLPRFGHDFTEANLPQEVDRNDQTISFNKGCYLGQETVARLDALGHVNKILRLLKIDGTEPPALGAVVRVGTREAGEITSVGVTLGGEILALGMLKVNVAPAGAEVEVSLRSRSTKAQVEPLPHAGGSQN